MESFETAAPIIVLVCSLTALLFSFIKFYSVKTKKARYGYDEKHQRQNTQRCNGIS